MGERIRDALWMAGGEIRDLLERLYVADEPGRFQPCLSGMTPAGRKDALASSCRALRVARSLELWDRVDKEEQAAWIAFICAYQTGEPIDGEPATRHAFLDPESVAPTAPAAPGMRWWRGLTRTLSPLADLARATTRAVVSALAVVDAYPLVPYRSLPSDAAQLQAELRRGDGRDPVAAAARGADLVALVTSQGRHFLELTELHRLRDSAASWLESRVDSRSGAFFAGEPPPLASLLGSAAHALDALEWIGRPAPAPDALIDTCLEAEARTACDLADWTRTVHHCLRASHHRRDEVQSAARAALERLLGPPRAAGNAISRSADLEQIERFVATAARLVEILEWESPRWQVLRR